MKQETVSGSGISWAICKSARSSRQITMPAPHHSVFLQAGCPSCHPTNSVKALKATLPDTGPLNGCVCVYCACISLLIYLGSVTDQESDKTNKQDKKFVQKDLAAKGQINTIKCMPCQRCASPLNKKLVNRKPAGIML